MSQSTTTLESTLSLLTEPICSRLAASEVLRKVAEAGSWGGFPQDVTCEELGRALERICLNAPHENSLWRVFRGWHKAARFRHRRDERSLKELREYYGR